VDRRALLIFFGILVRRSGDPGGVESAITRAHGDSNLLRHVVNLPCFSFALFDEIRAPFGRVRLSGVARRMHVPRKMNKGGSDGGAGGNGGTRQTGRNGLFCLRSFRVAHGS